MKAFHTIAVPHKDILDGNFQLNVFAADLWEAFHNRGPEEYRDASFFFQKTYLTEGLKNLLNIIEKRIKGEGSDPVIQIQTPFGGGKTHSLIALMHKSKEWKVNLCVIVGTNLSAEERLWEILEKQLTGKAEHLKGSTSPGKTKLKEVLEKQEPFLILIDELLEYVVKAGGIKVENSNGAAQALAFLQELTETVSSLQKGCLIVTLPSSALEQYDQNAEEIFAKLQKISGRVEKIYTPVSENEIAKVIQKRLFSEIKHDAQEIVNDFVNYVKRENLLPSGIEASHYRDQFLNSYPFLPEVIDVLYHRWGSLPKFQRTRGVLRILALVVNSLKNSQNSFISLADFDLNNGGLREEFLKLIGQEYNSVIAQDITNPNSGCKRVDKNLGDAYKGLSLGTRVGVVAFLYSFSGGSEKGVTLQEIKRVAAITSIPSSIVFEAVEQVRSQLFYFQFKNDKYYFENKPNLNRILLDKKENVSPKQVLEFEKQFLQKNISGRNFKVYIWEENSENIADTEDLKLIILREENKDVMQQIVSKKGNSTRINRNTLFFLCPFESFYSSFVDAIKTFLAYESLLNDSTLILDELQKQQIKKEKEKLTKNIEELVYKTYQTILIPNSAEIEKENLGIPTLGDSSKLDERVYEKLKGNKIAENLSFLIQKKYLANKQYEHVNKILLSFYRTLGEPRIPSREVFKRGIQQGLEKENFGIARLERERFKPLLNSNDIQFEDEEVLVPFETYKSLTLPNVEEKTDMSFTPQTPNPNSDSPLSSKSENVPTPSHFPLKQEIKLSFTLPQGKVSDIARMLNHLQTRFSEITLSLHANNGQISEQDYENQILETLKQLNIKYSE